MAIYRISRNIEASFVDFLTEQLALTWSDITVIKGFEHAYDTQNPLPVVAVRAENTIYSKVEIGSNSFTRAVQVFVNIFADSDGLRLDLKDAIVGILKNGLIYYDYTTAKSGRTAIVSEKEANGRIRIQKIDDTVIDFNIEDKSKLNVHDRYRHLLTCQVSIGKVE